VRIPSKFVSNHFNIDLFAHVVPDLSDEIFIYPRFQFAHPSHKSHLKRNHTIMLSLRQDFRLLQEVHWDLGSYRSRCLGREVEDLNLKAEPVLEVQIQRYQGVQRSSRTDKTCRTKNPVEKRPKIIIKRPEISNL
jgi:hypothetical protein